MSKKVIKDQDVKSDKLKHFGFKVYETVERGEKPKKLEKVGEMEYVPGEVVKKSVSFDDDIEMGRAIIVQDRMIKTEKYVPQEFSGDVAPVNAEPEKEPEPEPEPVVPLITEEELAQARKEGHTKGKSEGLEQGRSEGRAEAQKKYEAEQNDYMQGLQNAYAEVISQVKAFSDAVTQLDDALPNILVSMVKDIIGEERKINNEIVTSVAKKALPHLRELEKVIFLVNPADVENMKEAYPDYETQPDPNVAKGNLRVSTNIGEMNFKIEKMLAEFVERIHEEFSSSSEG